MLKRKMLKIASEMGLTAKINKRGAALVISVKSDRWYAVGAYSLISGQSDDDILNRVRGDLVKAIAHKLPN